MFIISPLKVKDDYTEQRQNTMLHPVKFINHAIFKGIVTLPSQHAGLFNWIE